MSRKAFLGKLGICTNNRWHKTQPPRVPTKHAPTGGDGGGKTHAPPPIFHLHICLGRQPSNAERDRARRAVPCLFCACSAPPSDEDIAPVCRSGVEWPVSISSTVALFAHVWQLGREDSSSNCALTAHYEALKSRLVGGGGAATARRAKRRSDASRRFERFNFAVISARARRSWLAAGGAKSRTTAGSNGHLPQYKLLRIAHSSRGAVRGRLFGGE